MAPRVQRFADRQGLIDGVAELLLHRLIRLQQVQESASLCLTGGRLANAIYDRFALIARDSKLKPDQIHLWWSWDYFTPTDDAERNSLQALSHLAAALAFDPAKIHPMASSSAMTDPEAGAMAYSADLAAASIDICLTRLYPGGLIRGCAAQPAADTPALVVPLLESTPPRLSLTPAGLDRAHQVWLLASGAAVADDLAQLVSHGPLAQADSSACAHSLCLVDEAAGAHLPFHSCTL